MRSPAMSPRSRSLPASISPSRARPATRPWCLLAGKVTVRKKGRKVAELGTGDVVGEMSLVTNRPRNATVRAETFVAALVMDSKEFATVMDEHPQVAAKILRTVAERLTEAGHD